MCICYYSLRSQLFSRVISATVTCMYVENCMLINCIRFQKKKVEVIQNWNTLPKPANLGQWQQQQPWAAKRPLLGIKGLCSSLHESDYLTWESNAVVQPVFLHCKSSLLRIQSLALITCKLAICKDERWWNIHIWVHIPPHFPKESPNCEHITQIQTLGNQSSCSGKSAIRWCAIA